MQPAEKPAASIWETTSPARTPTPALTEPTRCEIVVIGGGLTGLSAALHLARKGHQVTLLESHTIGFGGSGRNTDRKSNV